MSEKPKLLVIELWGVGDLILATPFLRAASEKFTVTLLAKSYAADLQARFWPGVETVPFVAPWTAFRHKYRLHAWPWGRLFKLWRKLSAEKFDVGLSARWDPRDHLMLRFCGARERLGFPRLGSQMWLTRPLSRTDPTAHRYQSWRALGAALGLDLPPIEKIRLPPRRMDGILVHSGAGQAVRVWPLERYRNLVRYLRQRNHVVHVACDPDQREWWLRAGETDVATPHTVTELIRLIDSASVFIGNDSGPGHLAAFAGSATFTIFGPQLPEWFAPLHPKSAWIEGRPCPFKPCSDSCRFTEPCCIMGITEEEVRARVDKFLQGLADVPMTAGDALVSGRAH